MISDGLKTIVDLILFEKRHALHFKFIISKFCNNPSLIHAKMGIKVVKPLLFHPHVEQNGLTHGHAPDRI
jgi:hypothetical protein